MEGELITKPPFYKSKKFWLIFAPVLLLVGLSALIWFFAGKPATNEQVKTTTNKPAPALVASVVNGVMVAPDVANQRVVAAMIENSPAARPQVGLTSADLVYEAVTEGGITRFMALFQQSLPDKAGPIRSARSYFIDYLSEYDGMYVHEGGSPTALARISQYGIKDYANPNDGTYHREPQPGVASEHTLFASITKIFQNGTAKRGWAKTNDVKPWLFKDPAATATTTGPITINFSSSQFQVVWTQDLATNSYLRALGGVAHKDRVSGEQIRAKTIVVMTVSHSPNPPYAGTGKESEWTMATTGTGKASVFQDGTRIDGTWKKPSRLERTRFYDSAGQEITLNRGKIWVEVIPQDGSVAVTTATP